MRGLAEDGSKGMGQTESACKVMFCGEGGRQVGEGMRGGSHLLSLKTEKIWTLKSPAGLQCVGAGVPLWGTG